GHKPDVHPGYREQVSKARAGERLPELRIDRILLPEGHRLRHGRRLGRERIVERAAPAPGEPAEGAHLLKQRFNRKARKRDRRSPERIGQRIGEVGASYESPLGRPHAAVKLPRVSGAAVWVNPKRPFDAAPRGGRKKREGALRLRRACKEFDVKA